MKSTVSGYGLILTASLLAVLSGCGGGGGGNTPSAVSTTTGGPVTTAPTWTPADATLNEFTAYTFTTTATDPVIGVSIASYQWTFGDGNTKTTTVPTVEYSYSSAGSFTLQVAATNSTGQQGSATSEAVTVATATNPFTVTAVSPSSTSSAQVGLGSSTGVTITFSFTVVDSDGGTIAASGINLTPGDTNTTAATVGTATNSNGTWSVPVTYYPAAATGTRTLSPTVQVTDSTGVSSLATAFPAITLTTSTAQVNATTPAITLTAPTAATTLAYTSVLQTVNFTLTDLDGSALTYSVDWGDGSAASTGSATSGTAAGVPITVTHAFADTYNASTTTPVPATVSITCTSGTISATPVTFLYNVIFNTYPTATIISPQASGSVPAAVQALAIPATSPAVVILPVNGMATFNGTATLPGYELNSNTGNLTYKWSFPGGAPSSSNQLSAGQVTFAGTPGQVVQYLVTLTVTDDLGRLSSANPAMASPAATQLAYQQTYERIVVVDGTDSQQFTMSFLYRQRSGSNTPDIYSLATTTAHGYGAVVNIFQDGITNAYTVNNGGSGTATTQIPVRSDVPFWLTVPTSVAGDTSDKTTYQFSIPNAPGVDPDLETYAAGATVTGASTAGTLLPGGKTSFQFQHTGTTVNGVLTGPWNPQLQIVTGSGFGAEAAPVQECAFSGTTAVLNNHCSASGSVVYTPNLRWYDRLSVPLTDQFPVQNWVQSGNDAYEFSGTGILGYASIPEWFLFLKEEETRDYNTLVSSSPLGSFGALSSPKSMGFVIAEPTYNADTQSSNHYSISALQAFRCPGTTDQSYSFESMLQTATGNSALLDTPGLDASKNPDSAPDTLLGLNPTQVGGNGLTFISNLMNSAPSGPLHGGLLTFQVPYAATDISRLPNQSVTYNAYNTQTISGVTTASRANMGYAEYLWTSAWARPLVLNRTNLNYFDTRVDLTTVWATSAAYDCSSGSTTPLTSLPWFFYSNPTAAWPTLLNVQPDLSGFNLNVVNGGTFDASSPVAPSGTTPSSTGVGRFFWTAFTPHYSSNPGSLISRTWLAANGTNGDDNQIPDSFPTADATDATTAWGFLPPQDANVDTRSRNASGTVVSGSNGFRIEWYNPTVNNAGAPVPPDFWAVQLVDASGNTQMFLLSGSYPRATTQTMGDSLMTDCRAFIPLGGMTYQAGDTAAPGYCWFDVPLELRPATSTATVTVFALKAILKNYPVTGARVINRSEWLEAVKTVTASISTVTSAGDVSFAHKIPFNYPWDIVVVNGASVAVGQISN
jgi:hypothetical protein